MEKVASCSKKKPLKLAFIITMIAVISKVCLFFTFIMRRVRCEFIGKMNDRVLTDQNARSNSVIL